MYSIDTEHSNCTVSPLVSTTDIYLGKDGRYHLRYVQDLFLFSVVQLSYAGNMSAHGIILDNWKFNGNFSHFGLNYTNATIQWSITRAGQSIATLSSISNSSLPWRMSSEATIMGDTVSTVTRYFDLSFDEPGTDVFDVSVCVLPQDALFLALAIPGTMNGINLSQFRGNTRHAVANYTQLYPMQVGNIQVISNHKISQVHSKMNLFRHLPLILKCSTFNSHIYIVEYLYLMGYKQFYSELDS